MNGKNGKRKFFLLLAGILLVLNSIISSVYAMELGGFDVSTGVDDVDDWADWAEDWADGVSENESSGSVGILMEKQRIQDGKNRLTGELKAGRKSRQGQRTGQMQEIQK